MRRDRLAADQAEGSGALHDGDVAELLVSRLTAASSLALIQFDRDARIIGWSARAHELFGWTFDEVRGKTARELGWLYPDDRERVDTLRAQLLSGAIDGYRIRSRSYTKDKRVITGDWHISRIDQGETFFVLALGRDVSAEERAAVALEESEQHFRSLFDHSIDAIIAVDLRGRIMRANGAAARLFQRAISDLVGRHLTELAPAHEHPDLLDAFEDVLRGSPRRYEGSALSASGALVAAVVHASPILVGGRVVGAYGVIKDVSRERRAERDAEKQAQRMRELYVISASANLAPDRQIAQTIALGCRLLGLSSGTVYDASEMHVLSPETGIPERLCRLPLGGSGALALDNLRHLPELTVGEPGAHEIQSYIGAPIEVAGQRYGSLNFIGRDPRTEPFSETDRDLVQLMSAFVAGAIERRRSRAYLNALAYYDSLTGLPNRVLFLERLEAEIARVEEGGGREKLALLFLDLDHFKDINDSTGHALGDRLLQVVGERLLGCVSPRDTVARMGGDEFVILLADAQEPAAVGALAEKVRSQIQAPVFIGGQEHYVTASIGVAMYPDDAGDAEGLVKHADVAMYRAKATGRNVYQFFTPALNASMSARLAQEQALRKALERNEFVLHYQPQHELTTGRIVGAEVLVRWQHPALGLVGPDTFIRVAEVSGLIVPLGDWILDTALAQLAVWRASGLDDLVLAINLSARQFHEPDLAVKIGASLTRANVPAHALELEITETVAMSDAEQAVGVLSDIGRRGVAIAVDDFGTGYSSLGYLRRFEVDALKIDHSFVRDILTEPDDATIVRTVIGMAHSMKMLVVAEGVESEAQLGFLRAEGCDRVQGFLFSPGIPAAEFERYVRARVEPATSATGRTAQ